MSKLVVDQLQNRAGTVTVDVDELASYPITSAETTAGVTPTDYTYPVGNVLRYGAVGDGSTDDSAAFQRAFDVAVQAASSSTAASGWVSTTNVAVIVPAKVYAIGSAITLDANEHQLDVICPDGRAVLLGSGQSYKCFDFTRLWNNKFVGIKFTGFSTAVEYDTNNVDASLIEFENCEWSDCTIGVDTTSFATSRSTVMVFRACRCAFVPRLVNSYCDILSIIDCHFRNDDDEPQQAFIRADSRVTIVNSLFTPYSTAAGERWFDLYESDSGFSRGFFAYNTRFGKEGTGGIPVVYSYIDADKSADSRETSSICFYGGQLGSSGSATDEYVVVLAENAGTSYNPSAIGFYGCDWSASNGLVGTESGSDVAADIGEFTIYADDVTLGRLANVSTISSLNFVEERLLPYFTNRRPGHDVRVITTTGSTTLDAGLQRIVRFAPASALTITDVTANCMDGEKVEMHFRNTNTTINDASTSGSVHLAGGANFTGSTNDTLVIQWDRATSRWYEISRSVN